MSDARPRRIPGHRLTMEWSGEYGVESSSTGFCPCGWQESASSQREVRFEYRCHLEQVHRLQQIEEPFELADEVKPYFSDEPLPLRIELGLIANELEQMSDDFNHQWPKGLAIRLREILGRMEQ